MKRLFMVILLVSMALLPYQKAKAIEGQCGVVNVGGATLLTLSPNNVLNGFPETILDTNGLVLELCLDGAYCFFDPIEVGNLFSEQIGFGAEGFWWLAEATVADTAGTTGTDAIIVMGAEAAFNPEAVADGNQFPFTRLRIRIDVGVTGNYTVTHPYGVYQFDNVLPGVRAINISEDIQIVGTPHQGTVGPFLTWDPADLPEPPVGFIGDINIPHTVVGSPCGTNEFRVSAVQLDGVTPIDLNGDEAGNDLVTDLFSLQGKRFNGQLTAPLTVDRASYSRPASGGSGRVNIYATSTTNATVTAESNPLLPVTTLAQDNGKFFHSFVLSSTLTIPNSVIVTSTIANFNNGSAISPLVDEVVFELANYDPINQKLALRARSSDRRAPVPTLSLSGGLGVLTPGFTRVISNVTVPPASVSVSSSAGGSDSMPVSIVEPSSLLLKVIPAIIGSTTQKDQE